MLHTSRVCADAAGSAAGASASAAAAAAAPSTRPLAFWLLTTAGAVFVMVVLGGVTRLTRSGLSIVEWRPEGERLPTTEAEWAEEFAKYQRFPEYQRVNAHMSLEEFKPIYFMEWAHRMWGRAIGLMFVGPLAYFALTRRIPRALYGRLGGLLALGATQGAVGWWMVKSGLEHDRFKNEFAIPRVSPYRLATHVSCCRGSWDGALADKTCLHRTHRRAAASADRP
jgi:cytochrome c oxidase assembly protein subunit 15